MGAQKRLESSFDVFIAILAHKGLASYALGATLLESNVKVNRFNAVVWFFASATPAGIFLGFAISAIASSVISSAATALASGTFMYVAMMVSRRRAGLLFPGLGMHHNFTSSTRGC